MAELRPYDRAAAVAYAHRWAFGRNPAFYNYDKIGGDCTNFASQVLYTGVKIMNFTPTYGWYYIDANDKAPAWTGVPYFFNFMTRSEQSRGPVGRLATLEELEPGDFIQLRFDGPKFAHTPIVVAVGSPPTPDNILLAAHSDDADNRPLSTYDYRELRGIHILGAFAGR